MHILYVILILILILLGLEYGPRLFQRGREHFESGGSWTDGSRAGPGYFEENVIGSYGDNMTGSAVNIRKPGLTGGAGFFAMGGVSGETPAYLKCPSCSLQFDCVNYPYPVDDTHGTVCTTCVDKTLYNEFNLPVFAKSVGAPRVARDLATRPRM